MLSWVDIWSHPQNDLEDLGLGQRKNFPPLTNWARLGSLHRHHYFCHWFVSGTKAYSPGSLAGWALLSAWYVSLLRKEIESCWRLSVPGLPWLTPKVPIIDLLTSKKKSSFDSTTLGWSDQSFSYRSCLPYEVARVIINLGETASICCWSIESQGMGV